MHWVGNRRLRRHVLVSGACLAVLVGLAFGGRWQLPHAWIAVLLLPALIASWRRHNLATLGFVAVIALGLGLWRGSLYAQQLQRYQPLMHHKVTLIGRASEDAVYGQRSQLTFGLDHVRVAAPYRTDLVGSIKVSGFGANAIYRGDMVQVSGSLYPSRGNAQASISFASLSIVARNNSPIDKLRQRFAAGMQSALPEPLASFGLGLLIGQRSTLPPDITTQLQVVGLTHIIAVSGYNLTIILRAARKLLSRRSLFQATALCVLLVAVFLLLTGSSPSIVRAATISLLSIAAWYFGRVIQPVALLLMAAAGTALAFPPYIWGNVSWYLSFLAFFGVLVLAPIITKRMWGEREPKLLPSIVVESLCAEAMTLPYVLYVFGQVSLVALPANLLVVALVPLAMLLSLVAGLSGMLVPAIAGWIAWPAKLLLTYMMDVASLLARVPHALIDHLAVSLGIMLALYGLVALVAVTMHRKSDIITDRISVNEANS